MSRIGKLPITLPDNVDVNQNGSEITVKGKFGTLQTKIPDIIGITQNDNSLNVNLKLFLCLERLLDTQHLLI